MIGIGGSIIAICRSFIPDENSVMEPDKVMEQVVQYTHYMPKTWRGNTHTNKVKKLLYLSINLYYLYRF